MMPNKSKFQVQGIIYVLIGATITALLIHLSLGVMTTFSRHGEYLIASPYAENEPINDKYHEVGSLSNFHKRGSKASRHHLFETANSHFVEKRADSVTTSVQPQNYLNIKGEESVFPLHCSSCALVGTLGILKGSRKGSVIDKNSCIFRTDFSPVRGFEKDVGSRTTARIVDNDRIYPFLKKPGKLVTPLYSSAYWFLYNKREGDITRLYAKFLPFIEKFGDTEFMWFSKKHERTILFALKQAGAKLKMIMTGSYPSALWFSRQVMEDAKCKSIDIYGIPDPKICKRNKNLNVASKYWDCNAPNFCVNGSDAGNSLIYKSTLIPQIINLNDRKGLLSWAKDRRNVSFDNPKWPLYLFY